MFTKQTKLFMNLIAILFVMLMAACANTAVTNPDDMETAVSFTETTTGTEELPAPAVEQVEAAVEIDAAETAVQADPEIVLTSQTNGALTADEIAGLLFMREEEKLARDVYLTMHELWGMNIFNNIAASEQMHIDAVANLLNINNIPDPAANNDIGEFVNQDLQTMYDDLIATGSQSLADALAVGGAIEEIDILDLDERINSTSNSDIHTIYQNLRSGSENHLRSFASTYERQTGTAYAPQYLDQTDYDAILNSAGSRGNGGGNGNGNGNSNGDGQGRGTGQGSGENGQGNGNNGQGNGNNGRGNGKGQNG